MGGTIKLGLVLIKKNINCPHELSSLDKGQCIIYAGAEVRTPDTPLIHLEKGEF